MKDKLVAILTIILFVFPAFSCSQKQKTLPLSPIVKPKNVILIIGDGMGPEQVGLLLTYARQAPHSVLKDRITCFDRMMDKNGSLGVSLTYAHNVLVTDSAASGSQLATGRFSGSEMIGLDYNGDPVITVLERAIQAGKSTGLVTDTRITHATPAAFAAHQAHRGMETAIAVDMLAAGPDVLLGGGLDVWIPEEANTKEAGVRGELEKLTQGAFPIRSKRKDSRNLLTTAREKGYKLAFNRSQMDAASGKLLGLFSDSALPNAIAVSNTLDDPKRSIPTLKEMSAKAIEILSQNEQGFFLMIEAGQIDWAAHSNDAGLMLHEMFRLNETVNHILNWAENREDTLIILTADHTTGGFGFSYTGKDQPAARQLSGKLFKDTVYNPGYNFGDPGVLDKLYSQKLSYGDIFDKFYQLSKEAQTPGNLALVVNRYTDFPITLSQAERILETEDNPLYAADDRRFNAKTVPKLDNKDEFYIYQKTSNQHALLALAVASDQLAVWNTGAHTNTPVLVFAKGTDAARAPFSGVLHHTQLGQYLMDAVSKK
ncbi:MAG: alkaline phosphatase [Proteobacteria bacterium]|nr:alkaline phosphatase [Pseudomonadota bacterium]